MFKIENHIVGGAKVFIIAEIGINHQGSTNNCKNLISIWKNLATKHKIKLSISGIPSLAKFMIKSKHSQAYKTYITQEMLEKFFLVTNGVYMSIAHDQKILKKYEKILDKIFYDISLCERGKLSIYEILKYPISYLPFERLN